MTEDDVARVRTSFEAVKPIADTAASLFYGRLFEIAPEVRPMFNSDLSEQGRKLMTTLAVVVNGLDKPETILPVARQLAVKHVRYGVTASHYQPVGEALIWTLGQGLGEAFTEDVKASWITAYTLLAGEMTQAAYGAAPAPE